MKTTLQSILTALVVAVILASSASTFTSCAKKEDPAPTSTTTSTLTFPGISSYSAVLLGDQANSNPSYAVLTTGARVSSSNFSSAVDINFATTPQSTPTTPQLISPDLRASFGFSTNTTGGSATFIGTAPASVTFSSLRAGQLDSLATPSTKNVSLLSGSNAVSAGTLFVFKTAGGKKGVINISSVSYTPNSTTNTVQFDIKVQQ